MSNLRRKSDFNISAAEILLEKTLYVSSVHCSYYSCFQLLKYTIKAFNGIDYEDQAEEISRTKQNTHQYVISFIDSQLGRFVSICERREFIRKVKDLKQFRIEADYEDVEVSMDKGQKALQIAQEIRSYIIKNFNL